MNTVNATEPPEESVDALDTSNEGEGKGNVIICDSIYLYASASEGCWRHWPVF